MSDLLPPAALPAGHVLVAGRAGYTLEAVVGRSGLGVVYRARHRRLGRDVALKMVPAGQGEEMLRQRLSWEARLLARLNHPGIVAVHDFGEIDGQPFLVMDYPTGGTLATQLRRQGALPPAAAVESTRTVALALDAVHRSGFVHRDVKPANLWVQANGSLCLADFMIARSLTGEGPPEREGVPIGTPAYMAPEQMTGQHSRIGIAADLYSLGVVLLELLTAHRPGPAWSPREVTTADPPIPSRLRPGIPTALDAVVLRCLARRPEERYPSAQALARALEAALPRTPGSVFPYEQLLAFSRGELSPPDRALIEARLAMEPRWRAHLESLRLLDLEELAARQDGRELERFAAENATPFCQAVAQSEGDVFVALLRGERPPGKQSRREWERHTDGCVYCRRMRRVSQARMVARAHQLPEGELLLRDWLLERHYRNDLDRITYRLREAVPGRDACSSVATPPVQTPGDATTVEVRSEEETVIFSPPPTPPRPAPPAGHGP